MKTLLGSALIVVAAALIICGTLGGVVYFFWSTIIAIMDLINMLKGDDPVTFGQVAGFVLWWFFREAIAAAIAVGSWIAAFAIGGTGFAMRSAAKAEARQARTDRSMYLDE
tara:strand:+ start:925 stop:1257 length:333 start_codon:yes stop_codon:yes gene_type:complete